MVRSVEELGSRAAPPAQRWSGWVVRAGAGCPRHRASPARSPLPSGIRHRPRKERERQGLGEFPTSRLPAGARLRLHGICAGCGHQGLLKARPGSLRPGDSCLAERL